MLAFDYTSRIAPSALRAAGATHVCRYLSWLPNPKVIGKAEYDELTAAGIKVVLNWEYDEHDWRSGASGARSHGTEAVRQAKTLGHPSGWPVPGSADFDMTRAEWLASGKAYAQTFKSVIRDAGYAVGVYGPWDVLGWVHDEVGFDMYWQSMSTAYSSRRNAAQWPGVHFWQRHGATVGGVQVDVNDVLREVVADMEQADKVSGYKCRVDAKGNPTQAIGDFFADQVNERDWWYAPANGAGGGNNPPPAGSRADLLVRAAQAIVGGALTLTDAQVAVIAAAITARPDNPLGPDDEPAIVAAVKQALREGAA